MKNLHNIKQQLSNEVLFWLFMHQAYNYKLINNELFFPRPNGRLELRDEAHLRNYLYSYKNSEHYQDFLKIISTFIPPNLIIE